MATVFDKNNREIYGVFSRNAEKVKQFSADYGVVHQFNSLDDVFSDDNVDAVYIATPHNTHFDIAKQAIEHGKHVLMEKAITLNKADLDQLEDLAHQHNVILLEAMTLVHMPLAKKVDLVLPVYSRGAVALTKILSFFAKLPPPFKISIPSRIIFLIIIFWCFALLQSLRTCPTIKIFIIMYKYLINV